MDNKKLETHEIGHLKTLFDGLLELKEHCKQNSEDGNIHKDAYQFVYEKLDALIKK